LLWRLFFAILCCIGTTPVRSLPLDNSTTNAPAEFDTLVDDYFNFYFESVPTEATEAGFHQYDGKLEDYSRSAAAGGWSFRFLRITLRRGPCHDTYFACE
jgi:hypothetical protein